MNWYKKAQLVTEKRDISNYYDIGHSGEGGREDLAKNYMWIYNNGRVEVVEETEDNPVHNTAFPNINIEKIYSGRYEPDTGNLSIIIPYSFKIQRMRREVPNMVLRALRSVFPNIKQVHVFT